MLPDWNMNKKWTGLGGCTVHFLREYDVQTMACSSRLYCTLLPEYEHEQKVA